MALKNTNIFWRDLEAGKVHEKYILELIQQKYPLSYEQEGYFKEWDIFIPELNFGVEVKFDEMSKETGNIVLEIESNGEKSGLATTKAKYWVIYDGYEYNWFLVDDLKRCIKENKLRYRRFTTKEDHNNKKAYIIKKKILYDYKILPEFYKAFTWAEKNGIKIYPVPKGHNYILMLEQYGETKTSGKEYSREEWSLRIKEFYIYLYKKNNPDV